MNKSNKVVSLPKPTNKDGKELTVEEATALALQPDYVPVKIERNGEELTFHVACDFDLVEDSIEESLRSLNMQRISLRNEARGSNTADPDAKIELNDEQTKRMLDFTDQERGILTEMALMVILGHDVPGMPPVGDELEPWLKSKAGRTQQLVLDAIIEAYDPSTAAAKAEAKDEAAQDEELPPGVSIVTASPSENVPSASGEGATPAPTSAASTAGTSKTKRA